MSERIPELSIEQFAEVIRLFDPHMDNYLYVMDLKADFYQISDSAVERFMIPAAAFYDANAKIQSFVYEKDRPLLAAEFELMQSGKRKEHNLHYRWLDRSGKPIWINCRGGIIDDADGQPRYLIGCINETGKKQRADNTSGLLGELELASYIRSNADKAPSGFFMRIGIDDLSSINSSSGTGYGDYILKNVASCISGCLSGNQKLFYLVAGEYMIVDTEGHTSEDAVALYKSIRKRISAFIDAENYKFVFTILAGILEADITTTSYEETMKLSDFTLSKARELGENSFYVFSQKDYEQFLRKNKIKMALYHAVDNNFEGFEAYYQPIVDSKTADLIAAEALMRFFMDYDGETIGIAPFEFIPILEETGLILPVGKWMLEESAAMCSEMQQYIPGFKINVNISYIQVMKSNILKDILEAIKKVQLAPECMGIELTESGYLDTNFHFLRLRNGLKENKIPFIIDDFGTGYSNLHCLSDLSPTYIKIDREFTNKALCNTYDHELMVKIIEMAHSLDLRICVEGIEETEALEEVRRIDADYIQGYLFGRPCGKKEFFEKNVL